MAASSSTAGSEADGPVTHPGVQSHRSKVSFRGLTGADSPVSYDSPSQMQSDGEEDVDPKNASKKQRSKKPSQQQQQQQQQQHHHHHHHSQHRHPSRHDFPYSASSSVADLSLLAGLVDDRSGWCEGNRISEEEIGARCKGKKRAVRKGLQEYYENLNYVLDGWRQADIVVDSQFPSEVLRRFGTVKEVEQAWRKSEAHRQRAPSRRSSGFPREYMRTQSHSQLMHLLSTSASDGASGLPQHHIMTSSDEEYGGQGYLNESQRSVLRRNRHDGHSHHHRNHADLEAGLIRAGGSTDDAEPASLSSRAANVLGLSSWFRYSTPSPPPQKQRVPRSLPTSSAPTRTPSEDESGFDSDSEPEPTHVGPQPKRRAKGTNEERQSLLKHDQKAADRGRGPQRREANGKGYGAATPDGKTAVRDVTPGGRTASALENVAAKVDEGSLDRRFKQERTTAHLIAEEKKLATVGSMSSADGDFDRKDGYQQQRRDGEASTTTAYDEEARDEVADLPGGKRERERLALRRAVPGWQEAEEGEEKSVQFAININLFINVLLLAGKGIAVLSSSSVSLLASLVDSALDLLSTLIIFGASKLVAFKSAESYFKYPRGKKNFEPLGVVIFSVLMIASFCQVLVESIERLRGVLTRGSDPEDNTALPWIGIAFMVATIGIKTIMWLLYRKSKSAGVRAVAQDSQNDVVFNTLSLTFPFIGSWLDWPALDAIGGICLSLYIISEWVGTLIEMTTKLSGARANPSEVARVLYLITRFKSVRSVPSLEVYYSGEDLTVEADVCLPIGMPLKQAHDLGEIVNYCVEALDGIERAYIHLDYNEAGQPAHISTRG